MARRDTDEHPLELDLEDADDQEIRTEEANGTLGDLQAEAEVHLQEVARTSRRETSFLGLGFLFVLAILLYVVQSGAPWPHVAFIASLSVCVALLLRVGSMGVKFQYRSGRKSSWLARLLRWLGISS